MKLECRAPVLIIEGTGDIYAVPALIRNLLHAHKIFNLRIPPRPISGQNIPKLRREGDLERFLSHGLGREGDSLLVLLDSDKLCAKDEVYQFTERASRLHRNKKIGFSFFNSEYESLFIACLDLIAERYPEYGWNIEDWDIDQNHEEIVGAKGYLSRYMKHGKIYKETQDQVKFTSVLDFARLREKSRSFRHFESTLLWLTGQSEIETEIYPNITLD